MVGHQEEMPMLQDSQNVPQDQELAAQTSAAECGKLEPERAETPVQVERRPTMAASDLIASTNSRGPLSTSINNSTDANKDA